ncbi:glutathione S-transferase family protein [Chondromyces apiculatus]|uniref:Glutathione S-transferase n=1 Tax=Chondromyces apiculatus DSM 436 TaxID=1192034 RepID=A0A017TEZ5_9BACT|nr:glutathione S-transferase family protein [Chondromyces apiculatus]EYF07819.1 Hypothetical protein CAP_6841 [Chondromyces apiculatus DSM 436]
MQPAPTDLTRPVLFGRSSSHFTRITRLFAAEMRVDYTFQVVRDLMSANPADYGGNPALRLPTLHTARGVWFGALNISRALSRLSPRTPQTVWPEDLDAPVLANAQEFVTQAMATEVSLVMAKVAGGSDDNAHQVKLRRSLLNMMAWLEDNARPALDALDALRRDRDLSYLEVTLFCLVTHLEFRDVLPLAPYPALNAFCAQFAARPSAEATTYRFDT